MFDTDPELVAPFILRTSAVQQYIPEIHNRMYHIKMAIKWAM